MLSRGVPRRRHRRALFGAASVFMAYEGFQLLTYDYEDIDDAGRTLPRAVLSAIVVVIGVYVVGGAWHGDAGRRGRGRAAQGGGARDRGPAGVRQ